VQSGAGRRPADGPSAVRDQPRVILNVTPSCECSSDLQERQPGGHKEFYNSLRISHLFVTRNSANCFGVCVIVNGQHAPTRRSSSTGNCFQPGGPACEAPIKTLSVPLQSNGRPRTLLELHSHSRRSFRTRCLDGLETKTTHFHSPRWQNPHPGAVCGCTRGSSLFSSPLTNLKGPWPACRSRARQARLLNTLTCMSSKRSSDRLHI
jgi:hypothetical protein